MGVFFHKSRITDNQSAEQTGAVGGCKSKSIFRVGKNSYGLSSSGNSLFSSSGKLVGLSMMCYTSGKEKRTCLGDFQLSGLIGKLLY